MPSFEQKFYRENPTRTQALLRDLHLLALLAAYALLWLTRGALVRRAYDRARRSGDSLDLDRTFED